MCSSNIVHLPNSAVADAFAKETELITAVKKGDYSQALLLWQTNEPTLVLPVSKKWQASPLLIDELKASHWQLYSRRTGGAPVPQAPGVINVFHIMLWDKNYSITLGYNDLCVRLKDFFSHLGLNAEVHATEFSYCNGDYNLNIDGRKIVGTAQRVMKNRDGQHIVLAQACILVDVILKELIKPVNSCNQYNQIDDIVIAEAHTCLRDHLDELPNIEKLFQLLTDAFIEKKLLNNI